MKKTSNSGTMSYPGKEIALREILGFGESDKKISLRKAIEIKSVETNNKENRFSVIPWIFLHNIIMVNYKARDEMIEETLTNMFPDESDSFSDDWSIEDDKSGTTVENKSESEPISGLQVLQKLNPSDLSLLIWNNSSPDLKQVIAYKMFICRLAIPLCVPIKDEKIIIETWPLRSIILGEKSEGQSIQKLATHSPCYVVSYLRLGNLCLSKSTIINHLLSDQYHNTFFNKDCPLGQNPRAFSCGLIEAAWRLDTNKPENTCLYLNLRGDGQQFDNQLKLLSQVSSVVVVMTKAQSLQDSSILPQLRYIAQCSKRFVLAIDAFDIDKTQGKQMCVEYLKTEKFQFEAPKICKLAINGKHENLSSLKKDLQEKITECIKFDKQISLTERLSKSSNDSFCADEEFHDFVSAKRKADALLTLFPAQSSQVKTELVPLQGSLWRDFTNQLKKEYDITDVSSLEKIEIFRCNKKELREKQFKLFTSKCAFMNRFLHEVSSCKTHLDLLLFIGYFKSNLDEKSRSVLPEVLENYHKKWNDFKIARDSKRTDVDLLKKECELAESNLADASFGFEHILRECGQIYESMWACGKEQTTSIEHITEQILDFAVKVILLGNPLELMDGDVANVALDWIDAVMNRLKEKIGDKKLLNLSVLGIQSSGKSTLLNTMFGLQFAVSAGRCTRGVFMQLIEVKDPKLQSKFDYIAIIDTEGLRANEIGHQKHDHDNKLATFIIGIADITIINIKGENTAEIKDILQIVVHAFLRLKQINDNLKLKQHCICVHQNVPAIDAAEKMRQGRQQFVETLDKMTREAAEQEQMKNIQAFNHVIEFDSEKDISYFSDLWVGDPPMAPTNPGYSKNCFDVKMKVITELALSRETFLTITDTLIRIKDLWQGILRDDFVYGFRNSLEMKAYKGLETKFHTCMWNIQNFFPDFICNDVKTKLGGVSKSKQLDKVSSELKDSLQLKANQELNKSMEDLRDYVKKSDLKDVQNRWLETKVIRLTVLKEELVSSSLLEINQCKDEVDLSIAQVQDRKKYEKEINDRASDLAIEMKGKNVEVNVLLKKFDEMWSEWFSQIYSSITRYEERPIEERINNLIRDFYTSEKGFLSLTQKSDGYPERPMTRLDGSLRDEQIEIDKHVEVRKIKHKFVFMLKKWAKDKVTSQKWLTRNAQDNACEIGNSILSRIDAHLDAVRKEDAKFSNKYVTNIMSIIRDEVIKHNETPSTELLFRFLPPFEALLISHSYDYIVKVLTDHDLQYQKRHSLVHKLKAYKETASVLFQHIVEQRSCEIIAADLFCKELYAVISDHVDGLIPNIVKKHVTTHFPTKFSIISNIMSFLANRGSFDEYRRYLYDPAVFAEGWLRLEMEKMLFESRGQGSTLYADFVKQQMQIIFTEVRNTVADVTKLCQDENNSIEAWVISLCSRLSSSGTLPVSESLFTHVTTAIDTHSRDKADLAVDLLNFQRVVLEQLEKMEHTIDAKCSAITKKTVIWRTDPIADVINTVWGCREKCPFCKEPCKHAKDHLSDGIDHQCVQHRIDGLIGTHFERTTDLTVSFCNLDVQTGRKYYYTEDNLKPYKEYRKIYPKWWIEKSSETSDYWKWVLLKYQKELEHLHGMQFKDIPTSWKSIDLSDAIKSVKY